MDKFNKILALLTASGTSLDVSKNLSEAVALAHEIVAIPVSKTDADTDVVAFPNIDKFISASLDQRLSLGGLADVDILYVFAGYFWIKETSQVGGGIVFGGIAPDETMYQLSFGYRDIAKISDIEMESLFVALRLASTRLQHHKEIVICTPSHYVVDAVSNWAYKWKKNGWRKSGGSIQNLKTIQEAHALYDIIKNKVSLRVIKDDKESVEYDILYHHAYPLAKETAKSKNKAVEFSEFKTQI